jgi:hypothetical protein
VVFEFGQYGGCCDEYVNWGYIKFLMYFQRFSAYSDIPKLTLRSAFCFRGLFETELSSRADEKNIETAQVALMPLVALLVDEFLSSLLVHLKVLSSWSSIYP